jgi:nucleotide sugar dehydrogenase
MTSVAVFGQGYVGLPLAIAAVQAGHSVIAVDVDPERVRRLCRGESPIGDVVARDVAEALGTGRYRPTTRADEIGEPRVFVITVPTPLREGRPDVSAVRAAAREIAQHLSQDATVILESTSYPGTTEEIVGQVIHEEAGLRGGVDYHLAFSPERIDPGNARWTLKNTPKLVAGVDDASLVAATTFYRSFVETVETVAGVREAEFAKLLENTFRQVNIALVNELLILARDVGVDFREVLRAAATKPFGYMAFNPGPGVGGHCLPIDPRYLSWQLERDTGRPSDFISLATSVNERMPIYVVDRIADILNSRGVRLEGARVLALGVTYKADSRDGRESPAVTVIQEATRRGAVVTALDPIAEDIPTSVRLVRSVDELDLSTIDLGVLLTNHSRHPVNNLAARLPVVLDTRHELGGENIISL